MPPKRGLSLEEKRTRLLDFFTREHAFYSIKEVEQQGGKFVGVHPMQMKDLLQSLVDDGLVSAEKCGVPTVYWCFEYDKTKKLKDLIEKQQDKLEKLTKNLQCQEESLKKEKAARLDSKEMERRVQEWKSLEAKRDELKKKLGSSGFTEDKVKKVRFQLQKNLEIAETCTDNIETLLYHFQKNNDIPRKHFQNELGIPEEFKDLPDLDALFAQLR